VRSRIARGSPSLSQLLSRDRDSGEALRRARVDSLVDQLVVDELGDRNQIDASSEAEVDSLEGE
jgi:hypothetical protein